MPATPSAELLAAQESASSLHFVMCGSVDDGKSTLIGRLLYDAGVLKDDQTAALATDSKRYGSAKGELDFALVTDGLEAEREQGITIDVAYRYFATARRRFVVADTPGHEEYTRNMATGASTSELAVLLVDARNGVQKQTRRHAYLASLFGLRHVVLAVNKIDLVDDPLAVFTAITNDFEALATGLSFTSVVTIPVSARFGDNVFARSGRTPWYSGPTLMEHLEMVDATGPEETLPFRMPVQWVNRASADFRGLSGTVAAGRVAVGDRLVVFPSTRVAHVRRIVTRDGDLSEARAGDAITLLLTDEVDVSSGDLLAAPDPPPHLSDRFAAHLVWMDAEPLVIGRPYLLKCGARTLPAEVTALDGVVDVDAPGARPKPSAGLAMNDVGTGTLTLARPLAFDRFSACRETGAFVLIDRTTFRTVAAGLIDNARPRSTSLHAQPLMVDMSTRAVLKGQTPVVVWLTGLSGAGKSTIANLVESTLTAEGRHTYLLDGDNVRRGLSKDLGFEDEDRVENLRRVAEVAKLFVDAGLIVLASFISPFMAERAMARELLGVGRFVEVFVDTPLDVCEARDPKGLYRRARAGSLIRFTGIDSPYEAPTSPDLVVTTVDRSAASVATEVVEYLRRHGYVP